MLLKTCQQCNTAQGNVTQQITTQLYAMELNRYNTTATQRIATQRNTMQQNRHNTMDRNTMQCNTTDTMQQSSPQHNKTGNKNHTGNVKLKQKIHRKKTVKKRCRYVCFLVHEEILHMFLQDPIKDLIGMHRILQDAIRSKIGSFGILNKFL